MKKFRFRSLSILVIMMLLSILLSRQEMGFAIKGTRAPVKSPILSPKDIQLDSRLPLQTLSSQAHFTNINAKFGSRLNFSVQLQHSLVASGTDGVFHDTLASYIVGLEPSNQEHTFLFHMGTANIQHGDTYLRDEQWRQGLDTTRWEGSTPDNEGIHLTVDIIDTFKGEPGCTAIAMCAKDVRDDTIPVFIIGVSIQNVSSVTRTGHFLFGSNRVLPSRNACGSQRTPKGTFVHVLSYDPHADATGGTLFLAGNDHYWDCNTSMADRAGLSWAYKVSSGQMQTVYMLLGGWNAQQNLFINTQLRRGCQSEGLYASHEWSSESQVINFAMDNLTGSDNLLGRAQAMENVLIQNTTLTSAQRWLLGDTLRSYKASSWLMARQACAGGGYDATVYEGSYGLLSTVDVMHEYGYFEITQVPWFFRAEMTTVFQNTTKNSFGTYFQHDQGGDVDNNGACVQPGKGIPTIRATCYAPPYVNSGQPMPVEENDDVALLMAYYAFITRDVSFVQQYITALNATMQHNLLVGDPTTGIAYNFQDTNTTYDAASDCLHNNRAGTGDQYYQGLKEATGYRATAYLDKLAGDINGTVWTAAASKIEAAMVHASLRNGFLPIANATAFSNCSGRTIALGEGLFYLHLIGQEASMNAALLHELAQQYPGDLQASTLASPKMIVLTSTAATGEQCSTGHCHRYEWFSKVMLSNMIATLVYTKYGCSACQHLDMIEAAYTYNIDFADNFGDGFHDDNSDWGGHFYPRGIISWAYLSTV